MMKNLIPSPLKELHIAKKAELGEFAGWEVALSFTNSIDESLTVRNEVGVFDVSHMGRIIVKGKDSKHLLDYLITKNVLKLKPGKIIIPTAMLNEKGGFIDDLSLFMLEEDEFLIVCNVINRIKILNWIKEKSKLLNCNVEVNDITLKTAMLAIQGRKIDKLEFLPLNLERESFLKDYEILSIKTYIISKSGWTGENGFEIITGVEEGKKLWLSLLNNGIKPCGIVSRDILRLEAGFLLYGNEINEEIDPIRARYWIFSLKKGEYIGKKAIEEIIEEGVDVIRACFVMKDKGPLPRKGSEVYAGKKMIGKITSGGYSPSQGKGIAMGYIKANYFYLGGIVQIKIREVLYEARIQEPPFFKK